MNILFCSAGRRCELLKDFRKTMGNNGKIIATDISVTAPAIYMADKHYIVPCIEDKNYIPTILDICEKEKIQAVTTLIDPEIMLLAEHRKEYLQKKRVNTVLTYGDIETFEKGWDEGKIDFPVFVKPRKGSGSVGARKIGDIETLKKAMLEDSSLIIQEFMGDALDVDADIYVDTISNQAVSLFSKRKLETKIGGASKTIWIYGIKTGIIICQK